MPSLVPSFTLTNHGSQSAGSVSSPHGVAVVLAGDVAAPREQVLHRLVHAAVAVGQLVGVAAGGEREDLVPEADAEDGLAVGGQQGTHLPDQRHQVLGVAGAVADDDAVALGGKRREVGVPGCAHHRCSAFEERADHVVLGSRIHQQHLERAALVADDIVSGPTRRKTSSFMSTVSAALRPRAGSSADGRSHPFIVPCSRNRRVSVRVSMPVMPGTSSASSQAPSERVAAWWLYLST